MESASSTRVFSVSEMIIEAEDGPESTINCDSESNQQTTFPICVVQHNLKNENKPKDAILISMNNAAIEREDCSLEFYGGSVAMDVEESGQDQQAQNILSDQLNHDATLTKTSEISISKEGRELSNTSTKHGLLNAQKNAEKVTGLKSLSNHKVKIQKANPPLPSQGQDDVLPLVSNLMQQPTVSKRTRKPTQKMSEYICRLCETNSYKLIKIFGTQGNQLKLAEKIQFHLPIQVNAGDKLPQGVCASCINALNVCNDLYQKCLNTDCSLRKIFLNESQTKIIPVDCLQPNNISQMPSAISSACNDSGQTETQIVDKDLTQSSFSAPKIKRTKKAGVKTAMQSKDKNQNAALSKESVDFIKTDAIEADAVEDPTVQVDAGATASSDGEENLWGQDEDEDEEEEEEEEEGEEEGEEEEEEEGDEKEESKDVTCDLCPEVFANRLELTKHRKTHPAEERLKCPDCGKVLPNDRSYYSHRKIHTSNIHPCHICGKILASTSGLKNHYLIHDNPKFCCQICGKTTRTIAKLQIHMASHSDERPFSCDVCSQTFKLKSTLKQHSLTHTERRMFVCDICGHSVNRSAHLKLHLKTHQPGTRKNYFKHPCDLCTLTFRSTTSLVKHKFRVHGESHSENLPGEPATVNLVCGFCSKTYTNSYEYGLHVKVCSKVYQCVFCEKVLATQRSLENHLRGHTGEKPFPCKFCDIYFKNEFSRDAHERIHTGERPFKCKKCDKAFRTVTNLYQHKLTHDADRKYSCSKCKYKTHRRAALRVHFRVHTGEKPYTCDICGKSYKASWDLKLHSQIHSPSGVRKRRVRQKAKTQASNLALTETSESGDSADVYFNKSASNLDVPNLAV